MGPKAPIDEGGEEGAVVLPRHFERIVQCAHVDVPGHLGIPLAHGRQQRHEIEDRIDVISRHNRSHGRGIKGVEHLEGTVLAQRFALAHVGGHDIRPTVNVAQINCQLGTDLASGAYYQNTFHLFVVVIA